MCANKTMMLADKIFFTVLSADKKEFFITYFWVMGNFGVSRNTADAVLARLYALAEQNGFKAQRMRGGVQICRP